MYSANPLRLDLRVLGQPPLDVIPPGESAITSLVVGADGNLYGGTSGKRAHLFVLDPKWGHVFPLGHLPGQESIFHAMAAAPDGSIYIGTSLLNQGRIDERGKDVLLRYKGYAGGHIFRFEPAKELQSRTRMQTPDPSRPLPFAADLGVPVAGESVVSLIYGNGALYGVTFPGGHFFVMDLKTGKTVDKGPVCGAPLNEEPFRSIPRALVLDAKGRVWGTGDYGALFDYSPGTGTLTQHRDRRIPGRDGTGIQGHRRRHGAEPGRHDLRRDVRRLHLPLRPRDDDDPEPGEADLAAANPRAGLQPGRRPLGSRRRAGRIRPRLRLSNSRRARSRAAACSTSTGRRTTPGWPTRPSR